MHLSRYIHRIQRAATASLYPALLATITPLHISPKLMQGAKNGHLQELPHACQASFALTNVVQDGEKLVDLGYVLRRCLLFGGKTQVRRASSVEPCKAFSSPIQQPLAQWDQNLIIFLCGSVTLRADPHCQACKPLVHTFRDCMDTYLLVTELHLVRLLHSEYPVHPLERLNSTHHIVQCNLVALFSTFSDHLEKVSQLPQGERILAGKSRTILSLDVPLHEEDGSRKYNRSGYASQEQPK
mmetsp:Transcript_3584/g.9003  ORF Transcript_3584/g.9003 Transcript_3584/m.9003 type:complete len:241 (+) Transcript_3584:1625-2347(+)